MGYQIEYIVAAPEQAIRSWLETLSGFFYPDPGDVTFGWEGGLRSGSDSFIADAVADVTKFSLGAKYSWLFNEYPPTVDFARRFEREFWRKVGPFPLIRLDEFLRAEWEKHVGKQWWQIDKPAAPLLDWLATREPTHWTLLFPRDAGSQPVRPGGAGG
jgi:hypothetical protein